MKQKGDKWPWVPGNLSSLWRHQIFPQDLERGHEYWRDRERSANKHPMRVADTKNIKRRSSVIFPWTSYQGFPFLHFSSGWFQNNILNIDLVGRASLCWSINSYRKEERLSLASVRRKNPYPARDRTESVPMFFWGQQKHKWPSILNFVCLLSPPMGKTLIFILFSIWETWTTEIC